VQHSHDVEANVQPDEVRESQGPIGCAIPSLKDFVDGFLDCYVFHHREHGFVQQRHQYAIRYESRRIVDLHWRFPELCRKDLVPSRTSHPKWPAHERLQPASSPALD
jgi:hypothetical protein